MNSKFFQLCNQVSDVTGWDDESLNDSFKRLVRHDAEHWGDWFQAGYNNHINNGFEKTVPIYTSDYLLDKLKGVFGWSDFRLTSDPLKEGVVWECLYHTYDGMDYKSESSEPVIALLELIIILDEAGELK